MISEASTEAANAVSASLREGYSLPSRWYTDPAIFEIERQTIFRRNWLYFCHVDDLKAPGTYRAATVGTFPVVVTRTQAGELKGFLNVCRHRLHRVVEDGTGSTSLLLCRYHAWSYDLDGALRGLPRAAELADVSFDKEAFGLLPVRLETWGPLVFVNLTLDAPPLMQAIGSLAAIAGERGVNFDTQPRCVDERIVAVNWKIFIDNVIECYHCPTVHPSFTEFYDTSTEAVSIACEDARCAIGIPLRKRTFRQDDPSRLNYEYHSYFLPPTFYLSARKSDWLFMLVTEPIDVGHIRIISQFCFPEGASDEYVQTILDGAIQVNAEDIEVATSVQRGHAVGGLPPSYLLPHSERQLREFAAFVHRAVTAPALPGG